MRVLLVAQAVWDAASVVVAMKARRVMLLYFMLLLLNPNGKNEPPQPKRLGADFSSYQTRANKAECKVARAGGRRRLRAVRPVRQV